MWEKSFPITFHQMKIVHSITKDDKTWKKVLYNHSLSNLPIAQNKIKFMKKMHQSNFVNWRGTVKSNLSVIKSHTIVKLFLKSNPIFGNKRNKKLGLFHIWPHCEYFFILRAKEKKSFLHTLLVHFLPKLSFFLFFLLLYMHEISLILFQFLKQCCIFMFLVNRKDFPICA